MRANLLLDLISHTSNCCWFTIKSNLKFPPEDDPNSLCLDLNSCLNFSLSKLWNLLKSNILFLFF
ncbi:hypothetical protein CIPAW_14G054400 [Carya illinoinensis]|uniref:Uncharacterized protein n=1 Tax=Carya illinoinensis TaxID=32201 RepID=A0A8T1NGV5_CARIL|nr:hypothetical protein CIPAW_14G054400 [Carya illinoinensis]